MRRRDFLKRAIGAALAVPAAAEIAAAEPAPAIAARVSAKIGRSVSTELADKGWHYTVYHKPFAFTGQALARAGEPLRPLVIQSRVHDRDLSDEVIEPGGYEHVRLDEPLYQLEGREAWVRSDRVSKGLRTSDTLCPTPRDERVSIAEAIEQASSRRSEAKASYSSRRQGGSKSVPKESTRKKGCQGKSFRPSNGKVTGR